MLQLCQLFKYQTVNCSSLSQLREAILLLAVPRRLFCFGSLVILDVKCRFLSLFELYINIEIGKNGY